MEGKGCGWGGRDILRKSPFLFILDLKRLEQETDMSAMLPHSHFIKNSFSHKTTL